MQKFIILILKWHYGVYLLIQVVSLRSARQVHATTKLHKIKTGTVLSVGVKLSMVDHRGLAQARQL